MLSSISSVRATARLSALGLAASLLLMTAPQFAVAGGDVAIDNFTGKSRDGDTIIIPHAEFTNANLSKDEITALLTPDTPEADQKALLKKLKADKIVAPSIEISVKDGTTARLHDLVATDVAEGRVGKLGLSSVEGSSAGDGGPASIKSGALVVDDVDLADVLKSVGGSDGGRAKGRMGHLTWSAIDLVVPAAQAGAGKTVRIAVAALEMHSGYSGDVLKEGWTKLTGIVVERPPDSEEGKSLASLGYSRLELAMGISANYQADAKTLSLDNFTIEGAQMGSIALKANFSDVSPQLFTADGNARLGALLECGVASLELRLVNSGLFDKLVAQAATQESLSPDAIKQQWSSTIAQMAPMFLGASAGAQKAVAETQKFIASPQNLTIAVKAKKGALKADDLMAIGDPAAFAEKLDIAATANQ